MLGAGEWKAYCKEAIDLMPKYQQIRSYLAENPNTLKTTIYKMAGVSGNEIHNENSNRV